MLNTHQTAWFCFDQLYEAHWILYQRCPVTCWFFNQHLGFTWMRLFISLVQKSLRWGAGGTPKRMVYQIDLGKENYYISFSDFFEKKFLTQNQCHVFHTAVTYTIVYSEIITLIIFCFFCMKLNTAHNSILALEKRKTNLKRAIEKMHLLAAICILECTVISELSSYGKKKPVW